MFGSYSNSLLQELCEDSAEVSGSMTVGLGTGNQSECATGQIADSKLGYSIFFLVLWRNPWVSVTQK